MKSEEYLWNICLKIYNEMYNQSNPKSDFDKMIKSGETKQKEFFMKYYLPIEEQNDIIENICKKYKIRGHDEKMVKTTVHLGCSPNSSGKTWKEYSSAN